jgi:pteridine reductase
MAGKGFPGAAGDRRPVALVTGAGRRIGAATVRELARRGCRVALTWRTSRAEAAALARETGAVALQLDLLRPASFAAFAERFRRRFGRLDLLVHNAAVFPRTPFGTVDPVDWDAAFAVNARAPFLLTQAFLPLLEGSPAPGGPAVVFLGDAGAGGLWPSYLPYCLSKLAAEAESRALKTLLAPAIRVGLVRPGLALRAPDFPEDRWEALRARRGTRGLDSPEKVARAVARFVNPGRKDSHIVKV